MEWAEIKKALNSTVGTESFKPLDQIFEEMLTHGSYLQSKTVHQNGIYTADDGYDGLSQLTVDLKYHEKSFVASSNGTYTITPDSGYAGISKLSVSQPRSRPMRTFSTSESAAYYDGGDDFGDDLVPPEVEVIKKDSIVISHGLGTTPSFFWGRCDDTRYDGVSVECYFYNSWGGSSWTQWAGAGSGGTPSGTITMNASSVILPSDWIYYLWGQSDEELLQSRTFYCVAIA